MALPANIAVSFDYSSGATFSIGFTIGDARYGVIGVSNFAGADVENPVIDLTPNVSNITINRGRNVLSDQYVAGDAVVRVLDPDGAWNPQNPNSPYFPYLTPLRKLRVSATTDTADAFLFSGYTTEYRYTFPQGQEIGYVDIYCSDAFKLFNLAQIRYVDFADSLQFTGVRVNRILNQIDFPYPEMQELDVGNSIVEADPFTLRTALSALKNIEFSEQGAFYIDGSGTAVFKSRHNVIKSINATPIEFDQTTGIPYKNLVYAFDDKLIINQCEVQRYGFTTEFFAEDADSVANYFPHRYSVSDLMIWSDADALNIARTYVATRKSTVIRIDAMTVDLLDPAVPTDTMIGLDYFDNVRITNTNNGSTIVKTLQVQGLSWKISPNTMEVTVTTLEPIVDGFVLNSSERGIIGVSVMTY
jgi:hypothetical protein